MAPTPPPGSPFSPELYAEARDLAMQWVKREGWDAKSLCETSMSWGDMDAFHHLNNVVYFRLFEDGRIQFISSTAKEHAEATSGEPDAATQDVLKAQGLGLIIASISARYRRPVTFPDTLLIAHRVKSGSVSGRKYELEGAIWSYASVSAASADLYDAVGLTGPCASLGAVTTTSTADVRWYDHSKLKPAECDDVMVDLLKRRAGPAGQDGGGTVKL